MFGQGRPKPTCCKGQFLLTAHDLLNDLTLSNSVNHVFAVRHKILQVTECVLELPPLNPIRRNNILTCIIITSPKIVSLDCPWYLWKKRPGPRNPDTFANNRETWSQQADKRVSSSIMHAYWIYRLRGSFQSVSGTG